jgi:hypothetical protein
MSDPCYVGSLLCVNLPTAIVNLTFAVMLMPPTIRPVRLPDGRFVTEAASNAGQLSISFWVNFHDD